MSRQIDIDGDLVRDLRDKKGWSQQDLVDQTNQSVSVRTLSRAESTHKCSQDTLKEIALALEIEPYKLLKRTIPRSIKSSHTSTEGGRALVRLLQEIDFHIVAGEITYVSDLSEKRIGDDDMKTLQDLTTGVFGEKFDTPVHLAWRNYISSKEQPQEGWWKIYLSSLKGLRIRVEQRLSDLEGSEQ